MASERVAITIDRELPRKLDRLVAEKRFPSWSRAIQGAVEEKLARPAPEAVDVLVEGLDEIIGG